MFTKIWFSCIGLALSGSAFANATAGNARVSSRVVVATLEGQEAEEAFHSMTGYREHISELHGLVLTYRSNESMSCREAVRRSAKYSCVVYANGR